MVVAISKQVFWDEQTLRDFIQLGNLDEDEILIMTTRTKNWTVQKQALHLGMSVSSVNRRIALLKKKYDILVEKYPDKFVERKSSATELYLDNNLSNDDKNNKYKNLCEVLKNI